DENSWRRADGDFGADWDAAHRTCAHRVARTAKSRNGSLFLGALAVLTIHRVVAAVAVDFSRLAWQTDKVNDSTTKTDALCRQNRCSVSGEFQVARGRVI